MIEKTPSEFKKKRKKKKRSYSFSCTLKIQKKEQLLLKRSSWQVLYYKTALEKLEFHQKGKLIKKFRNDVAEHLFMQEIMKKYSGGQAISSRIIKQIGIDHSWTPCSVMSMSKLHTDDSAGITLIVWMYSSFLFTFIISTPLSTPIKPLEHLFCSIGQIEIRSFLSKYMVAIMISPSCS